MHRLDDDFDPVGVWRLVAYYDVDEAGRTSDGPLGSAPQGVLIYTADGHVSVSMMRALDGAGGGTEAFMGYAGHWRLEGTRMVHEVLVSAHPHIVGTGQVRDVERDGEDLLLAGTAQIEGRPQRRLLRWRRADAFEKTGAPTAT
ncbi:lipocalin-like domain-containing protein [Streptomyces griseocarneus]|uniref:lipocalin-like domain-containing protein n=1 Tax=Streptomyces griseocarneus TaxID=51201 RepID=UPI00167ED8BD|nr:lipocalin-like domain-containing protein [Streptomyces griseocarneus]MBZ6478148.1 lipocalin-like domain-containing protein [Streptomyces griseocarneus]GHG84128.1 hypothetical protein GCM10018779_67470 [Streptomyces griseocarneus]